MTRSEHIRWCKQRAREHITRGDLSQAVASMISDLGKHPETAGFLFLSAIGLNAAARGDRREVESFINGFTE